MRTILSLTLAFTLLGGRAAEAQVADTIRALRIELRCRAPEGHWALTIVLDSARGPTYPPGRYATGTLTLQGSTTWSQIKPDYPCNSAGEFTLDQHTLWDSSRHPISKDFPTADRQYYTQAWLSSMGGPGNDSVMITLGRVEAGSLNLRGDLQGHWISGTWDLMTCDVCDQSAASGRFVAIRLSTQ